MMLRFLRLMAFPLRIAIRRYFWLARWLDYLDREHVYWGAVALYLVLSGLRAHDPLDAAVNGIISFLGIVLWRIVLRMPYSSPSILLATVWFEEVLLWTMIGSAAVDVVVAPGEVPKYGIAIAQTVVLEYLLVDMIMPPRPRKRVKVPKLASLTPAPVPA